MTADVADLPSPGSSEVSARGRFWRRLLERPDFLVAVAVIALVGIVAAIGPALAPYDPLAQNLRNTFASISADHLLGTDNLGRDTLSRLIHATRIAVFASGIATAVAVVVGVPIGLFIGYAGGWVDRIGMRLVEAIVALPGLVVVIALIAALQPGLTNAMIALGLVVSMSFVRLTRAVVLEVKEEAYVDLARVAGFGPIRIMGRHVLPNVAPPLIIQTSLTFAVALLAEAGLSFIGLGVQPPIASWGSMLADASSYIARQPLLAIPPGVAIAVTVLAFNLIGDAVRDAHGRGIERYRPDRQPKATGALATALPSAASESSVDSIVTVAGLEVSFPAPDGLLTPVISDVTLRVAEGECLGLVGESGCGKSVTALALTGLVVPPGRVTAGEVAFRGRALRSFSQAELRRWRGTEIGLVLQDPRTSLNPAFTIGNLVAEPLRTHLGKSPKEARSRAIELLERVGITDPGVRAGSYPHELSGGMAQRVCIAMALACGPSLLIADEPTTALDVTVQAEVLDLLRDLQRDMGMSMVFVTHDLGVVADICDRAAVMYAGQVVEQGSVADLVHRPAHPYMEGLLRAQPDQAQPGEELQVIPGRVPMPSEWPHGCRFTSRCSYAIPACEGHGVPIQKHGAQHEVRCIRATELQLDGVQP